MRAGFYMEWNMHMMNLTTLKMVMQFHFWIVIITTRLVIFCVAKTVKISLF